MIITTIGCIQHYMFFPIVYLTMTIGLQWSPTPHVNTYNLTLIETTCTRTYITHLVDKSLLHHHSDDSYRYHIGCEGN